MGVQKHTPLLNATKRLLRPLVKLLIDSGVSVQTFFDIAKEVYADVALNEFEIPGKKQSISRVSILTGMSRKEVQRIVKQPADKETETLRSQHRAASVVSGWVRDTAFLDDNNEPAILEIDGDGMTFSTLVKKYSGDMPVRAMLDELIRVKVVKRLDMNRVKLLARSYIPSHGDEEKLAILGTDVADLINTIEHNIRNKNEAPRFQRKVMYDNVPAESAMKFKKFCAAQSQKLIEEFDKYLSEIDRDTNPNIYGDGRIRTGVGIYYFEEELSLEVKDENYV